jgi:transglutaminase-like putative cysteine protease
MIQACSQRGLLAAIPFLVSSFMSPSIPAAEPLPDSQIATLQEAGKLSEVEDLIRSQLAAIDPESARAESLRFELERTRRIRLDYRVTESRLWELLQENVEGITRDEFDTWLAEGRFDSKEIDGVRLFVGPSVANLFHRHYDLNPRRLKPLGKTWADFLNSHSEEVREEFAADPNNLLPERHFRIRMQNIVRPNEVPEGEQVRLWMVYPQDFAHQSRVHLETATPAPLFVNAPDYPVRSLYFEQPSRGAEETIFEAVYTLSTRPRLIPIDPALVAAAPQSGPETAWFLREQPPHVQFVPELRELVDSIVGAETNPAIRARLIYDWIATNIRYSFAREYSTLHNISLYCYTNRYGDCGQITLLYMTLCRIAGIPARWQSGWVIYPHYQNLHDWCEIWLAPHGWVPVDPNYGISTESPGFAHLTPEARAALRDFYFGGMDAYRLVINRDHGFPHFPAKQHFRSDTVDFQRGELETAKGNLYFNQFRYRMELEVLDSPGGKALQTSLAQSLMEPGMTR